MPSEIRPRDVRFGIGADPRRRWFRNDLAATALLDGFSMLLPIGERFFIRSLKHYEPKVADARVRRHMRDFMAQEAFHSREHDDYNRGLKALGYDVDRMEARVERRFARIKSPITRLAVTCAIEHVTTTFAHMLLANAHWLDDAPAHYRRLWLWHAVEEAEHAAVALEVYGTVTARWSAWKRYAFRVAVLSHVFAFLFPALTRGAFEYARAEGGRSALGFGLSFARALFVRPGLLLRSLPGLLRYYRPNFDPAASGREQLVERWRRVVDDDAVAAE